MSIWNYIGIRDIFSYMKAPGVFTRNAAASKKGTYPFLGPRKREPTRIPMASSAWVFRPKNACPRALPEGIGWKCPHGRPRKSG